MDSPLPIQPAPSTTARRQSAGRFGQHSVCCRAMPKKTWIKLFVALIVIVVTCGIWPTSLSAQPQPIAQPGLNGPANNNPAAAPNRQNTVGAAPRPVEGGTLQAPGFPLDVDQMLSPGGLSSTLKIMLVLTVISLAPSVLIMTTCFIRFVIVLGLLRQALGTQQLPPNQVIVSLCLFLTLSVMMPVWQQAYEEGIAPYSNPPAGQPAPTLAQAFQNTARPLRRFMADQIEMTGNGEAIDTFLKFQNPVVDDAQAPAPQYYEDVPLSVLLPAYMLSELKTAFVIGFQIYLPFLVIDMVIASVLISMGMMMLPPVLISLPFKLLLFVMIDGWFLTVGMLLESVQPFT